MCYGLVYLLLYGVKEQQEYNIYKNNFVYVLEKINVYLFIVCVYFCFLWGILFVLLLLLGKVLLFVQFDCFDLGGDCMLFSLQQFDVLVEVSCGDMVFLVLIQELCNIWLVFVEVDFFIGEGDDFMGVYVIVDVCVMLDIIVDGVMEILSGSGMVICDCCLMY